MIFNNYAPFERSMNNRLPEYGSRGVSLQEVDPPEFTQCSEQVVMDFNNKHPLYFIIFIFLVFTKRLDFRGTYQYSACGNPWHKMNCVVFSCSPGTDHCLLHGARMYLRAAK